MTWAVTSADGTVTGTYASKTDLENEFGTFNVAKWSQKDNSATTADDDQILKSLNYADALIESRFRASRYAVPLTAISGSLSLVTAWAARLAGVWLYMSKGLRDNDQEGTRLTEVRDAVLEEIESAIMGDMMLNATLDADTSPSAPAIV